MNYHGRGVVVLVSLLAVTALGSGTVASQQQTYVVEQDGNCTELEPLSYQGQSVEEFYGYTTPENASASDVPYSANTPVGIEDANNETSSLFLYEGPDGLSLVVLHGGANGTAGGAATFEFEGLPTDGEWVVRDDPAAESVERWNRSGSADWTVDWGWRDRYTDGGAFQGGLGDEFEIEINPAFNDDAEIDALTPGTVSEWRALSLDDGSAREITLDLDEPVTVRTGSCS